MSPGRVDLALVRRHLLALDEAVAVLRAHRAVTVDALRADRERLWVIERGLQLAAQNVLDIATHLAASAGRDTPDYASSIDRLAELGVVPTELGRDLRGLAGFRNVLVHGYLEIDLPTLVTLLRDRLDDFATFARHVDAYLARG